MSPRQLIVGASLSSTVTLNEQELVLPLESLAKHLRVSIPIVDVAFKHLRLQQLVEVKGMIGNDYSFVLSQAGKQLASDRLQISQYAGACPVGLKDYHAATKLQAAKVAIDRRALRMAFSDLVVTDTMLDAVGPALITQSSIFLYGPSGNGDRKSVV